ncbi:RING finger protein [Thermomonospora echinospora]|uniref:hypothetical protein n=1 Tax=Thermomonospora echinospora TaxID=1992 RepID=UPI0011B05358|nr:hypothetical protein [Thermomonospora echinospora]
MTYTKRAGEAPRRRLFGPLVGRWAAGSTRRSEIEHAATYEGTLCGLPGEKVEIYRHPFYTDREKSCPTCRELALEHVRRWPPERD